MNLSHSKTSLRTRQKKHRLNRENGIALISVLWTLLLLSSLAATASYIARTNAILTHRALELAQAQAAADAAIVDTISKLSDAQLQRHPELGVSRSWEFQGLKTSVTVSNEAGRIDVNTADGDLILAFLYSQGVDESAAAVLLGQLRGHEAGGRLPVRSTGSEVTQSYGPLQSMGELRRIPSWRAQKIDCWLDSLTVYTGLPGISAVDATAQGLAALQWAQAHQLGGHDWINEKVTATGALSDRSVLGEPLRIVATSSVSKDVGATSEWVGRLTGDRRRPILTMRWEHSSLTHASCNDARGP